MLGNKYAIKLFLNKFWACLVLRFSVFLINHTLIWMLGPTLITMLTILDFVLFLKSLIINMHLLGTLICLSYTGSPLPWISVPLPSYLGFQYCPPPPYLGFLWPTGLSKESLLIGIDLHSKSKTKIETIIYWQITNSSLLIPPLFKILNTWNIHVCNAEIMYVYIFIKIPN